MTLVHVDNRIPQIHFHWLMNPVYGNGIFLAPLLAP
jgi:hypothetical protein